MLPVLLHRVANASQLLSGIDALLAVDPDALDRRADDLASAGEIVDEIGWLLALLASASGAHLLLDRRERAGLASLVACVRACLRREGRDLDLPAGPLPLLSPDVIDGWQLPWAVGSLLYLAGCSLPPRASLRWAIGLRGETWRVECDDEPGSDLKHRLEHRMTRPLEGLPAARLSREGNLVALELPRPWLLDPEVSP
jgi:hypothetical protein